jgi:hypothetical protein
VKEFNVTIKFSVGVGEALDPLTQKEKDLFWGDAIDDFVIDPLCIFIEEYFNYWVRSGQPLEHPVIDDLSIHLDEMDFTANVETAIYNVTHLAVAELYANSTLKGYIVSFLEQNNLDSVTVDCEILPLPKEEFLHVLLKVKELHN